MEKKKNVQKKENKNKTFEKVTYASWKPIEREWKRRHGDVEWKRSILYVFLSISRSQNFNDNLGLGHGYIFFLNYIFVYRFLSQKCLKR